MDRGCCTHIQWNITQPLTKRNNAIWSNMHGSRECHTEWSKSDREGEILYDIPYMWNLKNDTNELRNRLTDRKWTYGCWGEGIVRDFGMVMYTLLYLKRITNKDLLYSTWSSAQCYVAAWMGEGSGGERISIYVCMAESLCCLPETITTLLISYTPTQNKKFKRKKNWAVLYLKRSHSRVLL